jgi:hypothetical protein
MPSRSGAAVDRTMEEVVLKPSGRREENSLILWNAVETATPSRNSSDSGDQASEEGASEFSDSSDIDLRYKSLIPRPRSLTQPFGQGRDWAAPRGRSPDRSNPAALIPAPRVGNKKPPSAAMPESSGIVPAPFLTWSVMNSQGIHNRGSAGNSFTAAQQLVLILDVTNDSILSNRSGVSHLYTSSLRCTMQGLVERYYNLTTSFANQATKKSKPSGHAGSATEYRAPDLPASNFRTSRSAINPFSPRSGPTQPQKDTEDTEQGPMRELHTSQAAPQALNRELLAVSQDLMWRFVPKNTESINHPVCQAVWGSLDNIFRVSHDSEHFPRSKS